jgi:hypothetical protein
MLSEFNEIHCPYCGEKIEVFIDASVDEQSYIEDCTVCCRPIELTVIIVDDDASIFARRDDE